MTRIASTQLSKAALLVFGGLLTLHLFFQRVNETYSSYTTISSSSSSLEESNTTTPSPDTCTPSPPLRPGRANATLLMLTRNTDLWKAVSSVRAIQDRFNNKFQYPWVFLNDEEFTEEFKERIRGVIDSGWGIGAENENETEGRERVEFGVIPHEWWWQPDWIDEQKALDGRWELIFKGIIYADSISYRNMCRFNSGFFYKHPLLTPYKWYWRVEPEVEYFCDVEEDPFLFMERENKTYGFTISMEDFRETLPTLWDTVKQFTKENPQYLAPNNALSFISPDAGESYNLCHFWSNFEIASLDFFRSSAYEAYFTALEKAGGFYYERWGDAPVHSIAASLFLDKNQVHFWSDIGYRHAPFQHCPQGEENKKGRCSCDPKDNYDYTGASCLKRWEGMFK